MNINPVYEEYFESNDYVPGTEIEDAGKMFDLKQHKLDSEFSLLEQGKHPKFVQGLQKFQQKLDSKLKSLQQIHSLSLENEQRNYTASKNLVNATFHTLDSKPAIPAITSAQHNTSSDLGQGPDLTHNPPPEYTPSSTATEKIVKKPSKRAKISSTKSHDITTANNTSQVDIRRSSSNQTGYPHKKKSLPISSVNTLDPKTSSLIPSISTSQNNSQAKLPASISEPFDSNH
ncbi:hypothetical protein BB560_003919 [Smittium megazygosporum]|uniref:Uncharacterized protein n=1 Tax=Smittium megazygosporum TaxID=133381 RepID=A0A2T9ZAQ3_9FUNG|nr:hypothetical protein BB560_003919 [Smittium megazygosporum]